MSRFAGWMKRFIRELRRRRVIRVAVVYAGTAFVILQLGEILVEPFDLPGWTLRMVTFLLLLGFPLAIGLSWVYNITEKGVVRDVTDEGVPEGAPQISPFTSNGLIVGLLIVAIGLLLYPRMFSSEEGVGDQTSALDTTKIDERSIAVLPFEALSSGEKSETFARGVHDDLLTRLSNISDLTVISRTSVEQYRDTDLSLPSIADSLGVRWVMEGGVLESGGRIQVNAQLIDPETDGHIWADDYRRKLTAENLFAIQEEITEEIADALEARLTTDEQNRIAGTPTADLEAYRLYVKGRSQLDTRSKEGIRRAIEYFQLALQEDSAFALAWSGLADARGLVPTYGPDTLDASVPTQETAARRALELDPNLAEAHASMGLFHLPKHNGPAALYHLNRSVELKPSYAQARHWLGFLQLAVGRPKKGLRQLNRAVELNPQHVTANDVLTRALLANGKSEEALSQIRTTRRMSPRQGLTFVAKMEGTVLHHLGRPKEASQVVKQALAEVDGPGQKILQLELALSEAARGNPRRARRQITSNRDIPPFSRGKLEAALGHTDAAFTAFQAVKEWDENRAIALRYFYPDLLGPLREDPRYNALIEKINQQWGLNPDGSLPEDADASISSTD